MNYFDLDPEGKKPVRKYSQEMKQKLNALTQSIKATEESLAIKEKTINNKQILMSKRQKRHCLSNSRIGMHAMHPIMTAEALSL